MTLFKSINLIFLFYHLEKGEHNDCVFRLLPCKNCGRWSKITLAMLIYICILMLLAGCKQNDTEKNLTEISVWFHTGRPEEKQVIEDQVLRFNQMQKEIKVNLTLIPEGDYNTQVQAAAAEGKLPDLLDLDGPYLANYAWKNHLIPLDDLLPDALKNDLLPSIIKQGTYNGRLYAVGTFDSGLGLYADRKKLESINARIPHTLENAWNLDEFESILAQLAKNDPDGQIMDLRMDYRGEWFTYAFSPIIQSSRGDLIDRSSYLSADHVLNSEASVAALKRVQTWFQNGYIDPNTDSNSFTGKRTAISWCGHWEYPRYKKALGDDLILLPLPDFGKGSRTGMGSWCWAVTKHGKSGPQAIKFLEFLLRPEEILAISKANGAVPASRKAINGSDLYKPGGPLSLFVVQLEQTAVPRPQTPAYPVITSAFQEAFLDIRHGADIKTTLDNAVHIIDQDIDDNNGYAPVK